MPNHVTNIVKASKEVLNKLINKDCVDFNNIITCNFPHNINWYYMMAEDMAEKELGLSNHSWGTDGATSDIIEQKDQMVENYKSTGYMHQMDFARKQWGTKWNAYDSVICDDYIKFDTAWCSPIQVIIELSKLFPNEEIFLTYADEDIGHNCQEVEFRNGEIINQRDLTIEECCNVKGYDYEEYLKECED